MQNKDLLRGYFADPKAKKGITPSQKRYFRWCDQLRHPPECGFTAVILSTCVCKTIAANQPWLINRQKHGRELKKNRIKKQGHGSDTKPVGSHRPRLYRK
ncbi:hypothetical protein DAQ1742_00460 [Dickeya aquatica]|uniref:Uncharacterized protein n=1 Tax=Dickeya aquatica TaxID=1401087 RepID=A0A375A6D2_9GAMM|nr:hypothetical protein DAQ1742_00460 [Dickeya aquatica]